MKSKARKNKIKITLEFPFKPLSVNALYKTLPNGARAPSERYKAFKRDVSTYLIGEATYLKDFAKHAKDKMLGMEIHYEGPDVFTKQGLPSQRGGDVGGYEKAITDLIFKSLPGLDDKQIFTLNVRKSFLKKPMTTVEIWILE